MLGAAGGTQEAERWTLMGCAPSTQVKVSMKFNGNSGVQLRAPRDLSDLAAYTALKFYLQSPEPGSNQSSEDRFVLYMGSRQVPGRLGGPGAGRCQVGAAGMLGPHPTECPVNRPLATTWVWPSGTRRCTGCTAWGPRAPPTSALTRTSGSSSRPSASTGGEPAPHRLPRPLPGPRDHPKRLRSAFRTLQFGHMSVTVEKRVIHETKGDTVAPGDEGLLSLQPDDFVFYVGGYPSSFTVSRAGPGHAATPPPAGLRESRGALTQPPPTAAGAAAPARVQRLH